MRIVRPLVALASIALAFAGCGSSASSPSASAPGSAPASEAASSAAPKGLTIYYEDNCQVELIGASGQRILIDVADPTRLSSPAKATDILLTTHLHSDHYSQAFADSFPGKTVTNKAGEFTLDGIKIDSLDASHIDDDVLPGDGATNHIFVFDFEGFRIAHMGSTAQTHFTTDQMARLGKVDIAFMDFMDVNANADNTKPIKQIEQLQPKLAFATHSALTPVQDAGKKWPGSFSSKPSITLTHDQLPSTTTLFFMGQLASSYGAILNLTESTW
jgi:L-ascorbate metabolism protein UlaG (beta-lactamase superfamily)